MTLETVLTTAPAWAIAHAPVMLVAVPMLIAPLVAILPNGRLAWFVTVATAAVAFYLAIVTLGLVQSSPTGILSYEIGRWPPPIGIEFRTDALNAMILLLVTGIGFLASVFSWPTISSELGNQNKLGMFFAAFLLCLAGLLGVASTGDAFNLFVFFCFFLIADQNATSRSIAIDGHSFTALFPSGIVNFGHHFFFYFIGHIHSHGNRVIYPLLDGPLQFHFIDPIYIIGRGFIIW